jgi:hypothetical protein
MSSECRDIVDHDFEHFKKNKKDHTGLPVYRCRKCGMSWEEMQEIREAQLQLDGWNANKQLEAESQTGKEIQAFFRTLFGLPE